MMDQDPGAGGLPHLHPRQVAAARGDGGAEQPFAVGDRACQAAQLICRRDEIDFADRGSQTSLTAGPPSGVSPP
jgi:hypothetical protein